MLLAVVLARRLVWPERAIHVPGTWHDRTAVPGTWRARGRGIGRERYVPPEEITMIGMIRVVKVCVYVSHGQTAKQG